MSELVCSIVVPVYNSENTLGELYERINQAFEQIDADYELILVEDCGGDNSWEVMQSLRRADGRVKIIRLTKNFGQHNALMCGLSIATGQYVITMDDDLQNPPEEIEKLINTILDSDYDAVYGVPEKKKQSLLRKLSSNFYSYLNAIMFRHVSGLRISNFRIISKPVVDQILQINTPNPIVGYLILKVTERIGTVIVEQHERAHGNTTYSIGKLFTHFLNGLLYNSTLPLRMVSIFGVVCLASTVILGLYYLLDFLSGGVGVSGFTTLVLLILFFSGIIMFSIGIIGEYLLRIVQEVARPPQFVIRDKEI